MTPIRASVPVSLSPSHTLWRWCALPLFVGALWLLPLRPVQAGVSDFVFNLVREGSTITHETSDGKNRLRIRVAGQVMLTDAEDDVQSLTGRMSVLETKNGTTRSIEFKPGASGGVVRDYTVNDKPRPFDDEARRWLATLLPTFARESALNVDARIARLNAKGGKVAVMDEIDRIESAYARARYIEGVLKLGSLDDKLMPRLLEAVAKIDSSFEQKNALIAVMTKQTLNADQQVRMLQIVEKIDSSFEQKNVLDAFVNRVAVDKAAHAALLQAIGGIDSDFEKRNVLDTMIKRVTLDKSSYAALLKVVGDIDSDFEKANVLKGLINRVTFDKPGYMALFQTIDSVDSDFEKRGVLETLAPKLPRDSEIVARYRKSASGLSDFERSRAEKALSRAAM